MIVRSTWMAEGLGEIKNQKDRAWCREEVEKEESG